MCKESCFRSFYYENQEPNMSDDDNIIDISKEIFVADPDIIAKEAIKHYKYLGGNEDENNLQTFTSIKDITEHYQNTGDNSITSNNMMLTV